MDQADWPPKFPHRDYSEEHHQPYIDRLLGCLRELEKQTDPAGGDETAKRKDFRAFDALSVAMDLVECVAGWAIDHQIGLAAAGLRFVPLQPSGTKDHPDYLKQLEAVNTHEHERVGSRYNRENWPATAEFRRNALINLLVTMHTDSLSELTHEAAEALRALEFGETLPLLKANLSGRKAKYRALLLQLRAIGFIEFQVALGTKKKVAQEMVARAYGLGDDAIRNWEARLRKEDSGIGALKVSREISWAQNAASFVSSTRKGESQYASVAESSLERYGDAAIAKAGAAFQAVSRDASD